jgi:hypothetical protein
VITTECEVVNILQVDRVNAIEHSEYAIKIRNAYVKSVNFIVHQLYNPNVVIIKYEGKRYF